MRHPIAFQCHEEITSIEHAKLDEWINYDTQHADEVVEITCIAPRCRPPKLNMVTKSSVIVRVVFLQLLFLRLLRHLLNNLFLHWTFFAGQFGCWLRVLVRFLESDCHTVRVFVDIEARFRIFLFRKFPSLTLQQNQLFLIGWELDKLVCGRRDTEEILVVEYERNQVDQQLRRYKRLEDRTSMGRYLILLLL